MEKSTIRSFACQRFLELTPTRAGSADRKVNTTFRKTITSELMEKFGTTLASAATHYNHAFIEARKLAQQAGQETLAAALVGLGRPEDKKGGRKKKVPGPAAELPQGTDVALTPEQQQELADDTAKEAAKLYSVYRKKDDELIASDLTREQADELIDKARAAKKAALYLESEQPEQAAQ
jgi:hypothetical protein